MILAATDGVSTSAANSFKSSQGRIQVSTVVCPLHSRFAAAPVESFMPAIVSVAAV